jgi:diguanylate cyclase (GGDEF)-like protein/PAS domain S-box-containing protein
MAPLLHHFDSSEDNFDDLTLEPLCRMVCALLDAPAAMILISGMGHGWSHAVTDRHHQIMGTFCVGDNAGLEAQCIPHLPSSEQAGRTEAVASRTGEPSMAVVASVPFGPANIGRLLVLDKPSRSLSPDEHARLADVGLIAGQLLVQHREKHELSRQEQFYRMLVEASTETIVRGNLDGVRLYVSPSIRELLGYEPQELIGNKAADLTHPDDLESFGAMMKQVRDGRLGVGIQELRQRHKDGSWVWMEASLRMTHDKISGRPDGYVVSTRGIGKRKELEARLERMAGHDELTGLPNRTHFRRQLSQRISAGQQVAVFYMDLDGFKQVNDQFGHHAGDAVLQEVTRRLSSHMRDTDLVARLGGDEFTAIVDAAQEKLPSLCKRLIDAVALPFPIGDAEVRIGISIGVAFTPKGCLDIDALLTRADHALYEAKSAGKNTFRFNHGGRPDAT